MIFYLEDDENIRSLTVYTLEQTGHEAVGFSYARDMYDALKQQVPDMFILDVMLPDEDGFSVLNRLRSNPATASIPIMMLTAKSTEFDKVMGLDAGADDYMSKPFGMMELVSRVNALFRRCNRAGTCAVAGSPAGEASASAAVASEADLTVAPNADGTFDLHAGGGSGDNQQEPTVLEAGPIRMDTSRYEVTVKGKEVHLTRKEFQVLAFLIANKGMVVTRTQLLDRVWGYSVAGQTRTVDAHMQTLRKKLMEVDPSVHQQIETVRGVGYKMLE